MACRGTRRGRSLCEVATQAFARVFVALLPFRGNTTVVSVASFHPEERAPFLRALQDEDDDDDQRAETTWTKPRQGLRRWRSRQLSSVARQVARAAVRAWNALQLGHCCGVYASVPSAGSGLFLVVHSGALAQAILMVLVTPLRPWVRLVCVDVRDTGGHHINFRSAHKLAALVRLLNVGLVGTSRISSACSVAGAADRSARSLPVTLSSLLPPLSSACVYRWLSPAAQPRRLLASLGGWGRLDGYITDERATCEHVLCLL